MAIYAGWSSGKVSHPGIIPKVRALRTCWVVPPEKRLFYSMYISLIAIALRVGVSSAAMVTDLSVLSDHGFPPYFHGEQPPLPMDMNNLGVSLVSRRKSLYTVPREHLDLGADLSQQKRQRVPVARPPKKAQQCTEKSASLGLCQVGPEDLTRRNLEVEQPKKIKGPYKKSKTKTPKQRKTLPRRELRSSGENRAALGQGIIGAMVVLLCLLAVRPISTYSYFNFALANIAAMFAYARLHRWYRSREQDKKKSKSK